MAQRAETDGILRGRQPNALSAPRDPVQLCKLIGDILTGQVENRALDRSDDPNKD
jgi:hypothetical protein